MNRTAINYVMDYCEEQSCAVQITYENGEYDAFFKSSVQRDVCLSELNEKFPNVTERDMRAFR